MIFTLGFLAGMLFALCAHIFDYYVTDHDKELSDTLGSQRMIRSIEREYYQEEIQGLRQEIEDLRERRLS